MKQETIIAKLKKQIKSNGYVEDLGQVELAAYKDFVFKKYSYAEASKKYQALSNAIDSL